jgi:cobaltochelatase CobN
VFDEETLKRLIENNQYVGHAVMERLVEAHQRGFWEATENELEQLKKAYMDLDDM